MESTHIRSVRAALLEEPANLLRTNPELFVYLASNALITPEGARDHLRLLTRRVDEGAEQRPPDDLGRLLAIAATESVWAFTPEELLSIISSVDAYCEVLRVLANPIGDTTPLLVQWTERILQGAWRPMFAQLGDRRFEIRTLPLDRYEMVDARWEDVIAAFEADLFAPGRVALQLCGDDHMLAIPLAAFRDTTTDSGRELFTSMSQCALRVTESLLTNSVVVEIRRHVHPPSAAATTLPAMAPRTEDDSIAYNKYSFPVVGGAFAQLATLSPQTLGIVDRRYQLRLPNAPSVLGLDRYYGALVITLIVGAATTWTARLERLPGVDVPDDLGLKITVRLHNRTGEPVTSRGAILWPGRVDGSMAVRAKLNAPSAFAGEIRVLAEPSSDEDDF